MAVTATVKPDRADVDAVKSDKVEAFTNTIHHPGVGSKGVGIGAGGCGIGVTWMSLRFKLFNNGQSFGTYRGSSQWQIGHIPVPARAQVYQVLIPLSPNNLQTQLKRELQMVPALLELAVAAVGTCKVDFGC